MGKVEQEVIESMNIEDLIKAAEAHRSAFHRTRRNYPYNGEMEERHFERTNALLIEANKKARAERPRIRK